MGGKNRCRRDKYKSFGGKQHKFSLISEVYLNLRPLKEKHTGNHKTSNIICLFNKVNFKS